MGWLLAKAAISPRQAPGHLFTAARIFLVFMRTRRRFVRILRERHDEPVFHSLLPIEPQISAHLSIPELRQLAALARQDDPSALINQLLNAPSAQKSLPLTVRAKLTRFNEFMMAAAGRFLELPASPAPAPYSDRRTVVMAFHSGAPLVINGYAARSDEMVAAAEAAGWQPKPVLRLGYPQELNRFRSEPATGTELVNDREWRRLPDDRMGLLTRGLNDYVEAYARRLADVSQDTGASIIHAASNYVNGLAASYAARLAGKKSIYEVRGLWHVTKAAQGSRIDSDIFYQGADALEVEAVRRADAAICISGAVQEYLAARGADTARISVIPNAVCTRHYAPRERDPALARKWGLDPDRITVGYFGSFAPYEGLQILVDALELASSGGANIQALFVGGGPAKDAIRQQIGRAGLAAHVQLADHVPRSVIAQLYSIVDIAPVPRIDRPVTRLVPPIKLVEAMSSGVSPVVSALAPLTEIVEHERTGLVVPPGDANALATAITRLAGDTPLRLQLAAAARAEAEARFSREIVAAALNAVYAKVLEQ